LSYFSGLYTPFVYSVAKAELLGATSKQASNILVVIGIVNTISRIATGFVSDLPCVDSVMLYNVAAIVAGAVTCLVAVFNTYELLLLYGALFGVSIGEHRTAVVIAEIITCDRIIKKKQKKTRNFTRESDCSRC
jgi:MFS family permease